MKLTREDLEKVESKNIANILRRQAEGKTLTGPERKALSAYVAGDAVITAAGAFVSKWDELADALSVDRRTLTNFRERHAKRIKALGAQLTRDDGRHCVAEWRKFADEVGELRGKGVNNKDIDYVDERALRLRERQLAVEIKEHELKQAKDELLPVAHFETALGAMVAKFRQAIDALPGRIAAAIDEADRDALLDLLKRSEKGKVPYKTLRAQIEKGKTQPFTDFHARQALIETEMDALKRTLAACEFLQPDDDADEDH